MNWIAIVAIAWTVIGITNSCLTAYAEGLMGRRRMAPFWMDWLRVLVGPVYIISAFTAVCHLRGMKKG